MLSELYRTNSQSNVHWRYYLYNKEDFFQALSFFEEAKNKKDKKEVLNIIDTLLTSIEKDYVTIKSDDKFFLSLQYVNNSDSTKKYVDLYYNLAKSRLLRLEETIAQSSEVRSLDELREYYVRYKASAFFREAWFYVTKYHASDAFFELFVGDEVFNHLSNPDSSSEYLTEDMYLSCVLTKPDAEKIIKNVNDQKIIAKDFLLNDYVFYEGLQGVINDRYLLVYGCD